MQSDKSASGAPAKAKAGSAAEDAPVSFLNWLVVMEAEAWPEDTKKRRKLAVLRLL